MVAGLVCCVVVVIAVFFVGLYNIICASLQLGGIDPVNFISQRESIANSLSLRTMTGHISATRPTQVCMNLGICFGCLSRKKAKREFSDRPGWVTNTPHPIATTRVAPQEAHPPKYPPPAYPYASSS